MRCRPGSRRQAMITHDILLLSALGFLGTKTLMVLAGFIVAYKLM